MNTKDSGEIRKIVHESTIRFLVAMRYMKNLSLDEASRILGYSSTAQLEDLESGKMSISQSELCRVVLKYNIPELNETVEIFILNLQSKIEDFKNQTHPKLH